MHWFGSSFIWFYMKVRDSHPLGAVKVKDQGGWKGLKEKCPNVF